MLKLAVLKATNEFILVNFDRTKTIADKKYIQCIRRHKDAYFEPSPEHTQWFKECHYEIYHKI